MTYRDLYYYEDTKTKTCRESKLYENKHKNHATVYIPLENELMWLRETLKWWITEVWRKPITILRRFIPSKPLLLQR